MGQPGAEVNKRLLPRTRPYYDEVMARYLQKCYAKDKAEEEAAYAMETRPKMPRWLAPG